MPLSKSDILSRLAPKRTEVEAFGGTVIVQAVPLDVLLAFSDVQGQIEDAPESEVARIMLPVMVEIVSASVVDADGKLVFADASAREALRYASMDDLRAVMEAAISITPMPTQEEIETRKKT